MEEELINKIISGNKEHIYGKMAHRKMSPDNPAWNKKVKGTPLEGMNHTQVTNYLSSMNRVYHNQWQNFINGWRNVFGGWDVNPMNGSPREYLNEYMSNYVQNPQSFKGKDSADNWLKAKYVDERHRKKI